MISSGKHDALWNHTARTDVIGMLPAVIGVLVGNYIAARRGVVDVFENFADVISLVTEVLAHPGAFDYARLGKRLGNYYAAASRHPVGTVAPRQWVLANALYSPREHRTSSLISTLFPDTL